jgi:hypothetical protein
MKPREPQLLFLGEGLTAKHETARWLEELRPRPSLWERLTHNFHFRKSPMTTPDTTVTDVMRDIATAGALRRKQKAELAPLERDAADATAADLAAQANLAASRAQLTAAQSGGPGDALTLVEQVEHAERAAVAARAQRDAASARAYQAKTRHRSERWAVELDGALAQLREHLPAVQSALYHVSELTGGRIDEYGVGQPLESLTGLEPDVPLETFRYLARHFAGRGFLGDGSLPKTLIHWHGLSWRP